MRAEREVALGNVAADAGDHAVAEQHYRRAVMLAPGWSVPLYNLGLAAKFRGEWAASYEFSRRASELDPTDQAAVWNAGIAATALGLWREADDAWRRCGLPVPAGKGLRDWKLGRVPIRLENQEIVWCERLDPARARIRNIPFGESGCRYGDVLLHDGAPNGKRMLDGREVAVFDVLARLERSEWPTFVADLHPADDETLEALRDICDARSIAMEDWSTVRVLCRACSENPDAHAHHAHHADRDSEPRRVAFAAPRLDAVDDVLHVWIRGGRDRVSFLMLPPGHVPAD